MLTCPARAEDDYPLALAFLSVEIGGGHCSAMS